MQRSSTTAMSSLLQRQVLNPRNRNNQVFHRILKPSSVTCDVFINHRGKDTKRSVASLLYDHLYRLRLRPFLDNKSMKPGDKLFEKIDGAIKGCKVGVAMFSPHYCDSYFCLHELAMMVEMKKKIIPVFCDVKPSELHVVDDGSMRADEVERFRWAVEEAKYTVGLDFDSRKGNWSDVVKKAADIVIESLVEIDEENGNRLLNHNHNYLNYYKQLQNPYRK